MILKLLCLFLATSLGTGFQLVELKCWTQRNNSHYLGLGLQISENIDDTVECIRKCRELDYCHAVDIDTNSRPKCWYQQSKLFKAIKTDVLPKTGCTNYLHSPECEQITEGVDLNCWTVSLESRIWGLTQLDRRTLGECLEACTTRIDCNTVDWNTLTSPSCWIQTKPMDVSPRKLWLAIFGTNFMLNRECLKLLASVESNDLAYWKVTEMSKYGTEWLTKVNAFDLKTCLDFCKNNQYCYMVDFDPTSKSPCYAQSNPFVIKRGNLVWSQTGYNFLFLREEYQKKYPATHSVAEKSYCWFYLSDTSYSGTGLQTVSEAQSLDSCLAPCHSNPLCKAAIYDSNSGTPCAHVILSGNPDEKKYLRQPDVTLYVPDIGCTQDKDKR